MKYVINFYNELDTINLVLFWGIIFVTILIFIFSTIIVRKNKKLKKIIIFKDQEIEESKNELAIKSEQLNTIEKNIKKEQSLEVKKEVLQTANDVKETVKKENFNAEELVIDYTKKNNASIVESNKQEEPKEVINYNGPYQKNVLREMSSSQTSPIGIIKKGSNYNQEMSKAKELNDLLNNTEIKKDNYKNNYEQEMNYSKEMINKIYDRQQNKSTNEKIPQDNTNYLKEVSKKLSEATETDEIKRTEYEIKQEEEAIISYEELMKKKDQIKMIDEEDAVISINELYKRSNNEERLYNITKEEENTKFINELKDFRSDL